MSGTSAVQVFNRQRDRPVSGTAVRGLSIAVLQQLGRTAELGIHLVSPREMARVNWDFLQHEGSTDVITFDHGSTAHHLHGELFISVADAVAQAREFETEWTEEVARYVIHGLLHLCGYDDLKPELRRTMKREENRLVRWLRSSAHPHRVIGQPRPTRRTGRPPKSRG